MWTYQQSTGELWQDATHAATGYSGKGEGKNNPEMQDVPNVGPIPVGRYMIGPPVDTQTHGPYALRLSPDAANNMCGRSGFLIHGDSVVHPGTASEGCIILPRAVRGRVYESGDKLIEVVA